MDKKNYIVGFHRGHDCSYCILENGVPVVHEELERISRIKEGVGDGLKFFFDRNPEIANSISYFTHMHNQPTPVREMADPSIFDMMLDIASKNGGGYYEIGHHQAHAAHAYYSSKFNKALIITMDAGGWEYTDQGSKPVSVTVWRGKNNTLEPVCIYDQLTIGGIWHGVLGPLYGLSDGPPKGNQAGTVMAMAAVGQYPAFENEFYESFQNPSRFQSHLMNMKKYIYGDEQNKYNLALGLQAATEKILKSIIELHLTSEDENVCFSGGTALNSVSMGKVLNWFPSLKDIFIPLVPYDGGLCLGSAQYLYHHIQGNPKVSIEEFHSPYLGIEYYEKDVNDAIEKFSSKIEVTIATDDFVTDLLLDDKIICIFNGRSESGRRALGNRSIVANPKNPKMKDYINDKVKHRQWFRPFAPSILEEEVENWFVKKLDSPYMGLVIPFKEEVKSIVPAVVHLDGTGRLQTVTAKLNTWYYNFIKLWFSKSGVPILLNTSFNDREPIVETPNDAINCFLGTSIDYLYFPEYSILVKKITSDV